MSFENYPNAEKSTPTFSQEQKNDWRKYIIPFLIVVLLGTWTYIIWDKSKTKETIQQKDLVITETSTQRDVLQKELEDATIRYDLIKTSSANMVHTKDSIITKQDRDISQKRIKIQQLLSKSNASQEELTQAKSLIASLNGDIMGYKTQIETLEGEKIVLTNEKNLVTKQRDQVTKEFENAKTLIKEKDEVIDIASTLKASNFSIIAINEKSSGKEKETTVAKRVDKIRISFDLDANRVSQTGEKNIFICITGPDGKPLAVEAMGSGIFNTREGEEKIFTQKINVNYTQGQRQTLSVDWKQNANYMNGDYKIEVYNNGFKIGEGVRSLKKGGLFS